MKSLPSTPQEIIARREAVLAYITAHVGKILPVSRLIAVDMGCTTAQINHAFRMLSREGAIRCTGNGNSRVIMVTGVGSTLPRYLGKEVSSYVAREPEPEPVRVFNFACPRCGTRNCARHSPVPLITRAAAAMVLA